MAVARKRAIARKRVRTETYESTVLKYRKQGYWVAQDKNGFTCTYFYRAELMHRKYWLGPPAFTIIAPKATDWEHSLLAPIGASIMEREKHV